MPIQLRFLPLLFSLLLAASLAAQSGWSKQSYAPGLQSAQVHALGVWRNELVVGLNATARLPGVELRHLGRFDGERWHAVGTGLDGPVRAIVSHGGELWVGGAFRHAGGVRASGIARWDGRRWHAVGAGFDKSVRALLVYRGEVWAGGDFTVSGTTRVGAIARWDGSRWRAVGQASHTVLPSVRALASDGSSLFAGGHFSSIGGVRANSVARFDRQAWHALGSGTNGDVFALTLFRSRLVLGGSFSKAGGLSANNVAAWNGRAWAALGAGVQRALFGSGPTVRALPVFGGKLYVAGEFGHSGQTVLDNIAVWNGSALRPIGGVYKRRFPAVLAAASWNKRLYCGGCFFSVGQKPDGPRGKASYNLASYDGQRWHGIAGGWGFARDIRHLGRYRGELIAGGSFSSAGGTWAQGLARFDGDDWRALGRFDGPVWDMVEFGKDLWVAGTFRTVDGQAAKGVARFDGTRWHGVGIGPALSIEVFRAEIYVAGTGRPLRYTGTTWVPVGKQIFGSFSSLQTWGNRLYIGGFQIRGPQLYSWDGRKLAAVASGMNGAVTALGVHNGKLVVGGRFTVAGGIAAARIARWDGSKFSSYGAGLPGTRNSSVLAIASLNGELIVAGGFATSVGGNLSRWQGGRWGPLPGGSLLGGALALFADDSRRELHVGGNILRAGGHAAADYAIWQRTARFVDHGNALGTPRRTPVLTMRGSLQPRATLHIAVSSAAENSLALLVLGASQVKVALFGGVLVPAPDLVVALRSDGIGRAAVDVRGVPRAARVWMQAWILDRTAPRGFAATNAIEVRVP